MQCNEDIIERKNCYEYVMKWVDTKNFIDSSTFDNKTYVNKQPSPATSSCIFKCSSLQVGPYQVPVKSLEKALSNRFKQCSDENKISTYIQLRNLFTHGPIDIVDPEGTWRYDKIKSSLRRR